MASHPSGLAGNWVASFRISLPDIEGIQSPSHNVFGRVLSLAAAADTIEKQVS
jgi:hypothetical protein